MDGIRVSGWQVPSADVDLHRGEQQAWRSQAAVAGLTHRDERRLMELAFAALVIIIGGYVILRGLA